MKPVLRDRLARLTLDATENSVIWLDSNGDFVYANPATERHLGYTCEELLGMNIADIDPSRRRGDWGADGRRTRDYQEGGGAIEPFETVHIRKDGSRIPVEISAAMVEVDGEVFLTAISRDLRERNKAKDLEGRESFLRSIADALPSSVGSWSTDFRCRFANQVYRTHFGVEPEAALGMHLREILGDACFDLGMPRLEAVLSGVAQKFEAVVPDRPEIRFQVHFIPEITNGRVTGFFSVGSDVTDLKMAEERLEKLNAQLEERTRQAEAANRAKSEFLANVSHELRTPLNSVIGMAGLLLDTNLDAQQRDALRTVLSGGEALLDLLNEILDLSKIESGKFDLDPFPFEPRRTVDQVAALLAPKAMAKGVEFSWSIDREVPEWIVGDSRRLGQILLNLAGNAVKFTHDGSVRLEVSRLRDESDGVRLKFVVRDTGIGIPSGRLDSVFDKFTQVDSSVSRRYGGTGLGLAISRELVERMGGEIGVASEPGIGSEFWFTTLFGVAAPGEVREAEPSHGRGIPAPSWKVPPKVLVADDNASNRAVVLGLLRKAGCVGKAVEDGAQALAALAAEDFDLVLMDVQMPEVDGLEATRRLRVGGSAFLRSDIPVVALTASVMSRDREVCLDSGMDDFLRKPLFYSDLVEILDRWIPAQAPDRISARAYLG